MNELGSDIGCSFEDRKFFGNKRNFASEQNPLWIDLKRDKHFIVKYIIILYFNGWFATLVDMVQLLCEPMFRFIFILLITLGLILPSGEINWNCPCLGGMASGPCGTQFKEAFSCFHYSKEEVKGSECIDQFRSMQECMQKFPELYPQEEEKEEAESNNSAAAASAPSEDSALSPESDSTPTVPAPDSTTSSD